MLSQPSAPAGYPPSPPSDAGPEVLWRYLKEGLDAIMADPTKVGYLYYMELYTLSYNYCASSSTSNVENNLTGPGPTAGPKLRCLNLYTEVSEYLTSHLEAIRDRLNPLNNEELLRLYTTEWVRYMSAVGHVDRIFTYLNRHWVRREREEKRTNVYVVSTLMRKLWREVVFDIIRVPLADAVLRLVERQRNGEAVDPTPAKEAIDSFIRLGIDESYPDKESLNLYQEYFEPTLLETTEAYHREAVEACLAADTISDYVKKVADWLKMEEGRMDNAIAREPLVRKCEDILLREHTKELSVEFEMLLNFDEDEDLQSVLALHALLARVGIQGDKDLEQVLTSFEQHVAADLEAAAKPVDDVGEKAANPSALLETNHKYSSMVRRVEDKRFLDVWDKTYRTFTGQNTLKG